MGSTKQTWEGYAVRLWVGRWGIQRDRTGIERFQWTVSVYNEPCVESTNCAKPDRIAAGRRSSAPGKARRRGRRMLKNWNGYLPARPGVNSGP